MPDISRFTWDEREWDLLLAKIRSQLCTPFLGAGAAYPTLPMGGQIAREWSQRYHYPFPDRENLVKVAQYMSVVETDNDWPKLLMKERLAQCGAPDFSRSDEIHSLVAELNLPVYITTNYDNFMYQALAKGRNPQRAICSWHEPNRAPRRQERSCGTSERPLIFHLHGHLEELDSMVLTEDDYLDFLIRLSEYPDLLPPRVQEAFTNSSVLFLGYSLEDLNFKVVFRKLANYYGGLKRKHFSVQLQPRAPGEPPTDEEVQLATKKLEYLQKQYGRISVKVFWGTCGEFAEELRRRL